MIVNLAYLLDRPTGTTAYALNLLPHLQSLRPTYLATPASRLDPSQYISVPSHLTQGTKGHIRRLWWTQFQLAQLYQQQQARLLFSPIPEAPLSVGRDRCRTVVTCHDLIPLRFPKMFGAIKYYYRYYVRQVLTQAEQVICNSEATARDIVQFYGISAKKLAPIPLAHDANHFQPTTDTPQLPDHPNLIQRPYFVMLGRPVPYKNMRPAIAAMAQIPDCSLVIAGPSDPRYTPELKAFATERGVRSRVHFLSYVPYAQLPALLSHALALVFPSRWEGFGLPVLEAMACGTPVITANIASLPEVAGDAAYFIDDPLNADALGRAMYAIATDSQMRSQLRSAGLKRAKLFSWDKTGKATVAVLQRYL